MSRIWKTEDIANALGKTLLNEVLCCGVEIDTRRIKSGQIFVGIKGENFDGSAFAKAAIDAGAALAITSRISSDIPLSNQIQVEDGLHALTEMAGYVRQNFSGKVIGVTGSVGKTSVKEITSLAFSMLGETFATKGNFNNHIGLPLSICNMGDETVYAILEMGMNHADEIRHLAEIAKPDVAIITTVDAVHVGNFSSIYGVADAKAEIFTSPRPDMTAVLNCDNPYYDYVKAAAIKHGVNNIIAFGTAANANVKLLDFSNGKVSAEVFGRRITYAFGSGYQHQAFNTLPALAAVYAVGGDIAVAAEGFAKFTDGEGRGGIRACKTTDGTPFYLIDDSYNASPVSMQAALSNLGERLGYKIAILGDMLELGGNEVKYHESMASAIIAGGIDYVICCGKLMRNLYNALRNESMKCTYTQSYEDVAELLLAEMKPDSNVLIKGSHGSNMYKVAAEIRRICMEA